MNILETIFLGLIQGITEVLPISSSGHLVLAPWFFDFDDPGLAFSVALHIGTLVAIVTYFRADVALLIKGLRVSLKSRSMKSFDTALPYYILIATVPGAIAGYTLNSAAESTFRHPLLIALSSALFGGVLLLAERAERKQSFEKTSSRSALLTGLAQAVAIIPGVSRSGITISAGMFQGFTREAAARFSFLISTPIIAGAGLYEMREIPLGDYLSLTFWAGFLTAVIASFLSVKFLMNFVKHHRLTVFAYYRFALSLAILILYFVK